MSLLVVASVFALAVVIGLWRTHENDQVGPRRLLMTSVQIVCMDCSDPESHWPERTLLTERNRCSRCGGKSYLLASLMYAARRAAASQEAPAREGRRIIKFAVKRRGGAA